MSREMENIEKVIKWLGHSSVRIEGEKIVYIDPWKIKNPEPKADIVCVTHEHYDHCSSEDINRIKKDDTELVASQSCSGKIAGLLKTVKPGVNIQVKGISIKVVPAYNENKPFHPASQGGVGYIIEMDGISIYHAGDTDLIPEMQTISADVVLLPIGGTYTMNAREAAEAVTFIKPKIAIPIHYGTVAGSDADAEEFKNLCEVEVRVLPLSR